MNTIKIDHKDVVIIAHRGLSGLEVENTCPAFVAAGVKSYYGIETDVHVTKDGKYIICHDDNIKRVTGIDIIIEESLYEDIKKISIRDKDLSTRSDLVFPDLSDYIKICKKYNKEAILELKNKIDIEHIKGIIDVIKEIGWYDNTTFISFVPDNIIALRSLDNNVKIQFLTDKASKEVLEFIRKYKVDLDIYYKSLNKRFITRLHKLGIKVNCWTIDSPKEALSLIKMGVDMITSNILE